MRGATRSGALGTALHPTWEEFAADEIEIARNARPEEAGRCAHPDCRRRFNPSKPWARYCCAKCRRADQDEARQVGHMIARAALAAREGKHAKDPALRGLARAGRNYVDSTMTRWMNARAARAAHAEARLEAGSEDPAEPAPRRAA